MAVLGHWLLNGHDELLRLVKINQSINEADNQLTNHTGRQAAYYLWESKFSRDQSTSKACDT